MRRKNRRAKLLSEIRAMTATLMARGDDDADPTQWEPGDVVQAGGNEDTRAQVLQNDLTTKRPRILLCDDEYPEDGSWWQMDFEGYRRIRRASTEERRG